MKRNCNLFISGFYHPHQTSIATPSAEAKVDDDDDGADEIVNYKWIYGILPFHYIYLNCITVVVPCIELNSNENENENLYLFHFKNNRNNNGEEIKVKIQSKE